MGTPGRVLDHIARGTLVLDHLHTVVLDEADRMLDIGFRPDIERILKRCPKSRQTLLLSATVPPPVARLATRVHARSRDLELFADRSRGRHDRPVLFHGRSGEKIRVARQTDAGESPSRRSSSAGPSAAPNGCFNPSRKRMEGVSAIHGDLPQRGRDRVMAQFREGKVRFLVATDVVGRGIDVSSISHIINYDLPEFCDDYVHRVGRTGRMGRDGVAFSFVTPEQGNELTRIEVRINRLLKRAELEGFEPAVVRPAATPDGAASGHPRDRHQWARRG